MQAIYKKFAFCLYTSKHGPSPNPCRRFQFLDQSRTEYDLIFFFVICSISSPVPRAIPNDKGAPAFPSHRSGLLPSLMLSSVATPWQKISHQFCDLPMWSGWASGVVIRDAEAWVNSFNLDLVGWLDWSVIGSGPLDVGLRNVYAAVVFGYENDQ